MRRYRTGAHAKYDLKVHIVWVPKYRKRLLTGPVAVRTRDLLRQIATENDLHIISGKVAADHVHMFLSYRAHQNISQIVQWLKGTSSRVLFQEFLGLAGTVEVPQIADGFVADRGESRDWRESSDAR